MDRPTSPRPTSRKMAKLNRAFLSLTLEEQSTFLSSLPSPASPPIGSIADLRDVSSSEARPSPNKKEWRHSSGESVVLDDRFVTLRTSSCERLDAQLTEFRVLLIRSPPYTGKTSMAKLYAFYLAQKSASVLSINLLGLGDDLNNLDKHWKKQAAGRSWQECFDSASSLTIIIDEIQILYPLSNSHAFWQNIKAIQQRDSGDGLPQIRVLLFGPYGAPESAASISSATATPIELPRRLDLSFTWFDRTEYDEVMHSVDQATEEAHYMSIGPVAKEAIWSATRGHPGLVRRCLDHIYRDILPDLTETNADASTHIVRYLFSHAFFHIISNTRAAQRRVYTEEEKRFIEQLLAADENGVECDDVPGELIRTGIIGHLDSHRVAFSAPLFRNVVINRLYASPSPPATQEDFDQFIRSCIQRMNPRTLRQSFSKSSTGLLYERQWQMEFYRAATSMVTAEHVISPDVGTVFGCKGLVDFYINGRLKWAVELLRDGDRADEHAKRFASTGRKPGIYHTMLAEMNRHALLDFRTADIPASEMKPDFWYIQYSKDYTQATVHRVDCPPDNFELMGHHVAPTST